MHPSRHPGAGQGMMHASQRGLVLSWHMFCCSCSVCAPWFCSHGSMCPLPHHPPSPDMQRRVHMGFCTLSGWAPLGRLSEFLAWPTCLASSVLDLVNPMTYYVANTAPAKESVPTATLLECSMSPQDLCGTHKWGKQECQEGGEKCSCSVCTSQQLTTAQLCVQLVQHLPQDAFF